MKQRLAALILLLVLFGGAFAGVPLTFGEGQCNMGGMMDMECCKTMLLQKQRAKLTAEEELMCVLACSQNGTTLPTGIVRVTPPAQTIQPAPVPLTQSLPISVYLFRTTTQAHSPPGSPPTYLRNLTLLI
jgi:hypothetical protein